MNAFKYLSKPYSIARAECKVVGLIKQYKPRFALRSTHTITFLSELAQGSIPFHINSLLTVTDFYHNQIINYINIRILVYRHIPYAYNHA